MHEGRTHWDRGSCKERLRRGGNASLEQRSRCLRDTKAGLPLRNRSQDGPRDAEAELPSRHRGRAAFAEQGSDCFHMGRLQIGVVAWRGCTGELCGTEAGWLRDAEAEPPSRHRSRVAPSGCTMMGMPLRTLIGPRSSHRLYRR